MQKKSLKKAERPKRGLTLRQLKYRKNRLLGMNIRNAAVAAGYSEKYALHGAHGRVERLVKAGIIEELERAGATDKVLAQQLTFIALKATKMQHCEVELIKKGDGDDDEVVVSDQARIEVPDYHLQKETLETICKLKKHMVGQVPPGDNLINANLTIILNQESDGGIHTNAQANISIQTTD